MSSPTYVIRGDRAALGTLRREYAAMISAWFNDPEVRRGLAHRGLPSPEGQVAWIDEQIELGNGPRPRGVTFAIHDVEDGELVGVTGLENIDWAFGRADFGIWVGPRRGLGIGTDATRLVLDWAFTLMGLHNVALEVYDWNEQAQRSYVNAGFREIGRRRGAAVPFGERCDVILMDATADEFESPVLEKLR
jgi:RimJ/RimL family protein N-acetyltransferase